MTWIIVGIAIVVLVLIIKKFNKSKDFPVLEAKINTNDGLTYNVQFEKVNPETTSVEYLRLILSFVTKIYYMGSDAKEMNRINIRYFLSKMEESKDFHLTLKSFAKQIEYKEEGFGAESYKTVTATAMFKDVNTRTIHTKLPTTWFQNQLYFSIIALVLASIKHLDDRQQSILFEALKNLSNYYQDSDNANSLSSAYVFPNKAFIEATFTYDIPNEIKNVSP